MRLLHTFDDKKTADLFSSFLTQEGIENVCEITSNTDWGSPDYGTVQCILWVVDENYYDTAQRWLDEFKANPNHPIFHAQKKFEPLSEILSNKSTSPPSPGAPKKPIDRKLPLTFFLLFTCIALFIWGGLTLPVTSNLVFKKLPPCELVFMPSIDKVLLFDYPHACEIEDRIIKIYGMDKLLNPATLPPEGKFLLAKAYQEPYWNGIYPMAIDYFRPPYTQWEFRAPLFEKIRQGEVWRLFTPCVLHGSIFHLLFNMLWLVYLGNIVEDNLRSVRYRDPGSADRHHLQYRPISDERPQLFRLFRSDLRTGDFYLGAAKMRSLGRVSIAKRAVGISYFLYSGIGRNSTPFIFYSNIPVFLCHTRFDGQYSPSFRGRVRLSFRTPSPYG